MSQLVFQIERWSVLVKVVGAQLSSFSAANYLVPRISVY
jgi:hypothetical protein